MRAHRTAWQRRYAIKSMPIFSSSSKLEPRFTFPPAAATTHPSLLQENVMSDPTRPYEPLTSENAALVLVDHQVGLMTGVRDYSTGELKHNVLALTKAAKALKLPIWSAIKNIGKVVWFGTRRLVAPVKR